MSATIAEVVREQDRTEATVAYAAGLRKIGTVGDIFEGRINYRDRDVYLFARDRMCLVLYTRPDCWLVTGKTRSEWCTESWCCHYGMSIYGK
jgi:hypothetical protein